MVARVVKQRKAICQVHTVDKNKYLVPPWQEMHKLESMSYKLTLKVHWFSVGKSLTECFVMWGFYSTSSKKRLQILQMRTQLVKDVHHHGHSQWEIWHSNRWLSRHRCWSHASRNSAWTEVRLRLSKCGRCLMARGTPQTSTSKVNRAGAVEEEVKPAAATICAKRDRKFLKKLFKFL